MPRPLPDQVLEATNGGDPEAVRAHILAAALRVITADGLASASTRAIAAEAEIGAGTLYNYFDDRLQLLARAILHHTRELSEPLADFTRRAGTSTVAANLRAFTELVDAVLAEVVPLLAAAFAEPELLATIRREFETDDPSGMGPRAIVEYLAAERDLGRIRPDADVEAAGSLVVSVCHDRAFQQYLIGHPGHGGHGRDGGAPTRELDLLVGSLT